MTTLREYQDRYNELVAEARARKILPAPAPVKKFESRAIASVRLARLAEMLGVPALRPADKSIDKPTSEVSGGPEKEEKTAMTTDKKNGREIGKPPGKVADFKPVRAGTARAKVVEYGARGDSTVSQIAARAKTDRRGVLTTLNCLNRDCGYGYVIEDGKVHITFPGSKTVKDAIVEEAAA